MKPSERLAIMLKDQHGLDICPGTFRRTYAGRNMKAMGAWTWVARLDKRKLQYIGSQWPITYLVRCKVLELDHDEFGEISVDPSLEDMRRLKQGEVPCTKS